MALAMTISRTDILLVPGILPQVRFERNKI